MEWKWIETALTVLTLVSTGGWFVTYRAYKRKNEGEAAQAEADGWAKMQDVYQETINDLVASCDYIRNDRDLLRKENDKLRIENNELRDKIYQHEEQMMELKNEIARLGRQIESLNSKNKH